MHLALELIAGLAAIIAITIIARAALAHERLAGREAYFDGQPLNVSWSARKRDGWSEAWGEHMRSKLGLRQHRG